MPIVVIVSVKLLRTGDGNGAVRPAIAKKRTEDRGDRKGTPFQGRLRVPPFPPCDAFLLYSYFFAGTAEIFAAQAGRLAG